MIAFLQRAVDRLDDLAARLTTAGERIPPSASGDDSARRNRPSTALTQQNPSGLAARLNGKQLRRAERDTLAGALALPGLHEHLSARLQPDDFTHPPTAAFWAALLAVHHRGDPVDYVTVAWQAERDAASQGISTNMDELMSMGIAVPRAPQAYASAELVAVHATLRHTVRAGRDIQDAARTITRSPELLEWAARSLRDAQQHARRVLSNSPQVSSTSTAIGAVMPRQRDPATSATVPAATAERCTTARSPVPTSSTMNPSSSPRLPDATQQNRSVR